MKYARSRYFEQRQFEINQIHDCFEKIISELNLNEEDVSFSGSYILGNGVEEKRRNLTKSDLKTIHEIDKNPEIVSIYIDRKHEPGDSIYLINSFGRLKLDINVSEVDYIDKISRIVEDVLQLKKFEPKEDTVPQGKILIERIEKLESRVDTLDYFKVQSTSHFSCFLSYRFNKRSKTLALELKRYLSLLNVRVIDGTGYEPRRIDEKVKSRLSQSLDFIIYLITKDGESAWTRDELTISWSKGYRPILIIEEGATVDKGILGELEYLNFEGDHIGDSFIGILEALQFIRQEKIVACNGEGDTSGIQKERASID